MPENLKRATPVQCLDVLESVEGNRISVQALDKFCGKYKVTKGKDGKYPVGKLLDARAAMKEKQASSLTGVQGALRAKKLKVEIEILEAKRDEITRRLIPRDEHLAALLAHAAIVRRHLESFPKEVGAVVRDAETNQMCESAVNRILAALSASFEEAGL